MESSQSTAWKVYDSLRGLWGPWSADNAYALVCILKEINANSSDYENRDPRAALKSACIKLSDGDETVAAQLESFFTHVDSSSAKKIIDAAYGFSSEDLQMAAEVGPLPSKTIYSSEGFTPRSVSDLALGILDVQPGDKVIDFGSGNGVFLTSAATSQPNASYTGVEIQASCYAAAKLWATNTKLPIEYRRSDMLDYFDGPSTYNKIFSNYPWGMTLGNMRYDGAAAHALRATEDDYPRPRSCDWLFNRLLVNSLSENGLAVGIMSNGAAFNAMDSKIRQYFVEQGWIHALISLPEGLFAPLTNIGTTLVVLSRGGNDGIRMVDATDLGTKERRATTFSDEDVAEVLSRLGSDGDRSKVLTASEIAENDYSLFGPHYLREAQPIPCPTKFSDIIESMTRGASVRAAELDALTCTKNTKISYLNLSDIQDGVLSHELHNLESLDPKLEKYCVHTGDLLISKIGAPFKVAVAEIPEGQTVLANGNLHVVRLTDKADPYYIAAFLTSAMGKREFAMAMKGTAMKTVNAADIKGMTVPLEAPERQQEVADIYRAKLDEIQVYKHKLDVARAEVADLFSEEA